MLFNVDAYVFISIQLKSIMLYIVMSSAVEETILYKIQQTTNP